MGLLEQQRLLGILEQQRLLGLPVQQRLLGILEQQRLLGLPVLPGLLRLMGLVVSGEKATFVSLCLCLQNWWILVMIMKRVIAVERLWTVADCCLRDRIVLT